MVLSKSAFFRFVTFVAVGPRPKLRESRPEKVIQHMAANQGNKPRKLYFDANLGSTTTNQVFLCTQFTAGTPGDRYGGLLDALEACTGSTLPAIKRSRAVSAWFQAGAVAGANATTPLNAMLGVQFVQPTANGTNKTLTALSYLTVGNASVAGKLGNEAIYGTAGSLRHFAVQVRKFRGSGVGGGGTVSVGGVLYVQRQHSIEV